MGSYAAFLSCNSRDQVEAQKLKQVLEAHGVSVFLADEAQRVREAGRRYVEEILGTVNQSQHFVLFIGAEPASTWVEHEFEYFFEKCHVEDSKGRRMFVYSPNAVNDRNVPHSLLVNHRIRKESDLASVLTGATIELLTTKLDQAQGRLREAFTDYHYSRFWSPNFGKTNGIHIFTCARDMTADEARKANRILSSPDDAADAPASGAPKPTGDTSAEAPRRRGGRTNIDKWDYQTVLVLTRFFGSRYPNVNVIIEDPVSKLSAEDIFSKKAAAAGKLWDIERKLRNRDCIIVGSSDVSDFAELVLATLHGIEPYTPDRQKSKGFVNIKALQQTPSCGYWIKRTDEREGVARIDGPGKIQTYVVEPDEQGYETTYGTLVVADNPFNDTDIDYKILILSGFSGIATTAIALLIASKQHKQHQDEFYRLDQAYVDPNMQFEALISVRYNYVDTHSIDTRDARRIDTTPRGIKFEELVRIR
jgi:hypothetical protein